jgi:hypothetical protein
MPRKRPRTVLWGARRGDVQYGSRDWRRRNIPIGARIMHVNSTAYFDVGDLLDIVGRAARTHTEVLHGGPFVGRVVGLEPGRLGIEEETRAA